MENGRKGRPFTDLKAFYEEDGSKEIREPKQLRSRLGGVLQHIYSQGRLL